MQSSTIVTRLLRIMKIIFQNRVMQSSTIVGGGGGGVPTGVEARVDGITKGKRGWCSAGTTHGVESGWGAGVGGGPNVGMEAG
jgi:hypothetical protein